MDEEDKSLIAVVAVDDEVFNLDLIERSLRDYKVDTFADPRLAIVAAKQIRPAVVLVDFRMPHVNGLELVRALQADGLDFVCLLVTAYADLDEVVKAKRDSPTFSIVVKPWKPAELRSQVELAIKLHKMRSARTDMNEATSTTEDRPSGRPSMPATRTSVSPTRPSVSPTRPSVSPTRPSGRPRNR
jgi:DNA-binding NtrC family response regulator